ncbi:MAG: hypothetical protein H0T47_00420 [Planctomycetaceae bacterium]|nr:hypothetical protein [Planctomycetaceae bacterium]
MRRLFNALPLALAALPAAAELPPEIWFSPCGGPSATCVAPRVDHRINHALIGGWGSQPMQPAVRSYPCGDGTRSFFAEPITEDITATPSPYFTAGDELSQPGRLQPIADNAYEMLARWELASRTFYPVTEAERMRLRFNETELTGQQLNLVCEFNQAIDAGDLTRRYDWTNFSRQGDVVSLTAVPKDDLERLFYDSFIVDVDALTGQPSRVRFGTIDASGGDLNPTIALRPWLDESSNDIRLVGYEETPDPIRTADASENVPRRLDEVESSTPPAPRAFDCVIPVEATKP